VVKVYIQTFQTVSESRWYLGNSVILSSEKLRLHTAEAGGIYFLVEALIVARN